MSEHFWNIVRFRSERSAVIEFRKRVSWYAKQMRPCNCLADPMRAIQSGADFDRVVADFLEWRLQHDEEIQGGRKPVSAEGGELVGAA